MAKIELVSKLINHWKKSNLLCGSPLTSITSNESYQAYVTLPEDFKELYKNINGTADDDDEGFLFYRQQDLITMGKKFSLDEADELYNVVIFIDYMQSSWWYGVRTTGNGYEIGIIPHEKKFKPIAIALENFIDLYIADSERLYDYD